MTSGAREKRRHVPLSTIPERMQQAVLAIEDQSFYSHPGVNPVPDDRRGDRQSLQPRPSERREHDHAAAVADVLPRRRVQRGAAERHGLAAAQGPRDPDVARARATHVEGRDPRAVSERRLSRPARLVRHSRRRRGVAHLLRQGRRESRPERGGAHCRRHSEPGVALARSPIRSARSSVATSCCRRWPPRTTSPTTKRDTASREPLQVVARSVDNEAPYFVDMVGAADQRAVPRPDGATRRGGRLHHARPQPAARRARRGPQRVSPTWTSCSRGARRNRQSAQAALLAVDPRTGEILAMVGGRSYNQSQYNRVDRGATAARLGVQAVRLPRRLRARRRSKGWTDLTPASLTLDEPATFTFDDQVWEPRNYDDYDGEITCGARWRCRATSARFASASASASTRSRRCGGASASARRRAAIPSITLGVFELTPLEVAQAYTLFTNGGSVRSLQSHRSRAGRDETRSKPAASKLRPVARSDTTYLVTNMMRSVLNEGTGAGARASGLRPRRRRQERHDQRPARCVVRRLHAGAADGGVGGLRRQSAARPQRRQRPRCPSGPTS